MDGAVERILENKNNKLALRWAADLSRGVPPPAPAPSTPLRPECGLAGSENE